MAYASPTVTPPADSSMRASPSGGEKPARGVAQLGRGGLLLEGVPRHHAPHVGVHGRLILAESDAEDGSDRVGPDPGELAERLGVGRELPAVALHHEAGQL